MASLDFCLVVGVQSTKETFGIKMGSFSVEISQLSTDHPLESNIPIFDKSGVHLANITLSIAVVYSSEYLLDSAIERPPWDSIENVLQSLRDTENVPLSDYSGKVELIADLRDTFSDRTPTSSAFSDRRKELFMDFEVPIARKEPSLPDSSSNDPASRRKPLIVDVEVSAANRSQGPISAATRFPKQQLVMDVEIPRGQTDPFSQSRNSLERKRQLVMDVEVPSTARSHVSSPSAKSSPRVSILSDEALSPANFTLPDVKQKRESPVSSNASPINAHLSLEKEVDRVEETESEKQRRAELHSGISNQSAKPQPSSSARLPSRKTTRRRVNANSDQQLLTLQKDSQDLKEGVSLQNKRMHGSDKPKVDKSQSSKIASVLKQTAKEKISKVPSSPKLYSASPPHQSSKAKPKRIVPSTATSTRVAPRSEKPLMRKASPKGSRKTAKTTSGRLRRRSRGGGEHDPRLLPANCQESTTLENAGQCDVHRFSEGGKIDGCEASLDAHEGKPPKYLSFPDRHRLSGNLAILPSDLENNQDVGNSSYSELVQKLIHQIVTFRASLNKSAVFCGDVCPPAAANDLLNKGSTTYLEQRFKQLDENIGSVNRLLNSLFTQSKDYDDPKYARVAQSESLEEEPRDVAEVALLDELFFPQKDPKAFLDAAVPKTKKSGSRKALEDICQIHNSAPPNEQVILEGLPLRHWEGKSMELKSRLPKPPPESPCILHSNTQEQTDCSPALNLCLTLKVGKLFLSESTLKEAEEFVPTLSADRAAWSVKQGLKTSTCLLTISFPGLNHSKDAGKLAQEQSVTISPMQLDFSESYFGHESQLHWKSMKLQALELWKSEKMIVSVSLSWESGQSLICQGSVFLEEVFSLMPKAFQTKLGLYRAEGGRSIFEGKAANSLSPGYVVRTSPGSCLDRSAESAQMEGTLAARLEIAIDVKIEDASGKPMMGAWLYFTVTSVTGSKLQPEGEKPASSLMLVVKSDLSSVCQIPFTADWKSSSGDEVKAWRPLKGTHPDGVLPGPKQMDNAIVFIEVWRNWRGMEQTHVASADNLVGLVKIPLKCCSDYTTVNIGAIAVAEGEYYIWNPFKDVICGSLEVIIKLGCEGQMLKLQQQNRAARVIQGHAPGVRDGGRAGRENFLLAGSRKVDSGRNSQMKILKHVIEVTVQHATDLPEVDIFANCDDTYPPNEMNLSDGGALSSWDMRRKRSCKHEQVNACARERLLGTAKVLKWSLFDLISARQPSSPEVKKRFYVPVEVVPSLINTYKRAPTLAVQVAYFNLNKESRKHHIKGTIFSKVDIHEESLFEGVVEFDIMGATGLQDAEALHEPSTARYSVNAVNSYVRYSLFSANKQLAEKYPACLTPVQPNNYTPRYNWNGRLKLILSVKVLNELRTGQMSFEVWHHHLPQTRRNMRPVVLTDDTRTSDVLLGTALIPTLPLLECKQGVEGWHDLISKKGQIFGAINLQVYFKKWQVLPLGFTTYS
ncbi:hypothetical protein AXG93_4080s1090 [Marchantia polymorpha subsp. ruderalis]|uniref:Uncharacterized protein n=1 Tax=Marchantia polymorpha subsp. ruderalis TaxID=1480154 RepID=A0A176VV05_MARPO|nr:hypothetical protein AXG93_4080s1090 [Marchantia polymorpha subsp. ruderalis]